MTDFHALDLSGDRAALHRWDGRAWDAVATASLSDAADDMGRVLADLLAPVAGATVAVALPNDRIAVADIRAQAPTDSPVDTRTDWVALPDGRWRRMSLPNSALIEIEAFLVALGVRPGGCMAAAGDDLPPAWFGTTDSPQNDGRATDRPLCLGPSGPGLASRIAAARLRAHAVAARDPAHLSPLPDPAVMTAAATGGLRRALPRLHQSARAFRPILLGVALLAAVGLGLQIWHSVQDRGPADNTPDMAVLATGPVPPDAPGVSGIAANDLPPRTGTPFLDRDATDDDRPPVAPRASQQASLSAMDAPTGMLAEATFYSPPYILSDTASDDVVVLIIPGLDPVFRTDALALPDARQPNPEPAARRTLNAPGPPAQVYVVDERGLIRPSPEGRVSPDGFTVIAGPPPAAVRPRPERGVDDIVQVMRRADLAGDDPLRNVLPRLRPDGLAESRERDLLGGRTTGELAGFVPDQRPVSAQEEAGPAIVSAPVVALGPRPAARDPAVLARAKAAAPAAVAGPAVAAADVARATAPTAASVAEHATTRVSIKLSEINLLGTFGAGNGRRALVRLPSGQVVNLSVGDRVDGGRVQSIGDGRLGYVKSGRTVTLVMPRG